MLNFLFSSTPKSKYNLQAVMNSTSPQAQKTHQLNTSLTELSGFLRTQANIDTLYSSEKGGEIDFTNCPQKHFDANNITCDSLLKHALDNYERKLHKLQTTDIKLATTAMFGLVAMALSPLSGGLSLLISTAAAGYFGYQLKCRESVRKEYVEAQKAMTDVYIWVMNDTRANITISGQSLPSQNGKTRDAFAKEVQASLHSQIKRMHAVVNPMLSDNDIWRYTRNDLDDAITLDRNAKNAEALKNETTTKMHLTYSYLMYGQHQGNAWQIAQGIFEYAKRGLMDLAMSTQKLWQGTESKPDTAAQQVAAGNTM